MKKHTKYPSTNNTVPVPNVHYYHGNNKPTVYAADKHTLDITGGE